MIYLNNAATSFPKPEEVLQRVARVLREQPASEGRSNAQDRRYTARQVLSGYFGGGHPRQCIFTSGATESLNIALQGTLKAGEHVVTTETEHTSVLRPLHLLQKTHGIRYTPVPCDPAGYIDPEKFASAFTESTRLAVVNHASNVTGAVQDLSALGARCRERGILFVVDASQTAGHIPLNVEEQGIDILIFTGHKGLLGIEGCGGFYFRKGVDIRPLKVGGTGVRSDVLEQPPDLPHLLEAGTLNRAGIESMQAGVEYLTGQDDTGEGCALTLRDRVVEGLTAIPGTVVYAAQKPGWYVPVVSFNMKGISAADLGDMLGLSFDIAVRSGLHCAPLIHRRIGSYPQGSVRVSFGRFNTESDAEGLLKAVSVIAGKIDRS